MINFIIWIIVGALIGWAASIIMRTNSQQGLIADILVGIVGSFVGGYFLSPLFHVSTINEGNFSIPALLVSLEAPSSCWQSPGYFAISSGSW
jgi:uncharacterized membrane protein YeaQ/YmgE (transglycosylase-associated protein family)